MEKQVDVVIVGAGPVGLLTAIELTLGGARVVVLERLDAPAVATKALAMGPLGIEALQRRGMAEAVDAAEEIALATMHRDRQANRTGGQQDPRGGRPRSGSHFAGLAVLRPDARTEPQRHNRPVDQQAAEAMLAARAAALGIALHRGCEVTGLVERADGIAVRWTTAAGDGHTDCAYLVGCDGGRSTVRKLAGFNFPGTAPTMTMYQAVVGVDHPECLTGGFRHTSGGMFSYGFMPDRLIMMDFDGPPENRDAPVTREEIEEVLRRVSLADIRVTSFVSASRWTDNTRLVDRYRCGRILLAGDAAHIHSPFGGQGMSLGLGDAANLGWKLAAVVSGDMPESLLDSYSAERRPVAEAVLNNTLAQAAIMRPDAQSSAMRALFARLLEFDDVNRVIGETMTGLHTRYDLDPDHDAVGRLIGNRPAGGAMLYDFMQAGEAVLLDATPDGAASALVTGLTRKVRCVTIDAGPSMLIRPDACIAWTADNGDSLAGLEDAIHRWFRTADRLQR